MVLRVRCKSSEIGVLIDEIKNLGVKKKRKIITVNRSPFIYKKSRDQFEYSEYIFEGKKLVEEGKWLEIIERISREEKVQYDWSLEVIEN